MNSTNIYRKKQLNPGNRKGMLRLLGLPIIWVGLVFLWRGGNMFYIYFASASWPVVKAQVVSAKVVKPKFDYQSTTTGAIGSFTYEYQGKTYTSNHLDIAGGSNTNTADKEEKVAFLLAAQKKKQPVDAYVNPNDPSYAIIFREVSQNMIWNLLFGLGLTPLGYKISKSLFFKTGTKSERPAKT